MPVQFSTPGAERFADLAHQLSSVVDELEHGEAIATLFAFASMNDWIEPNDESGKLTLWPVGDTVEASVTQEGRNVKRSWAVGDLVDWDEHDSEASGYGAAMVALIDEVNEKLTHSALP
jgi:hypothetical protein